MKKVLLTVAVIATMGFVASCNTKNDCTCHPAGEGIDPELLTWEVKDFEGECKDVKWSDLGISQDVIDGYVGLGIYVECSEKTK